MAKPITVMQNTTIKKYETVHSTSALSTASEENIQIDTTKSEHMDMVKFYIYHLIIYRLQTQDT